MFEAIKRFLVDKWRDPGERGQDEYDFHLESIFASQSGQYVLNRWIADSYCDISYAKGLEPHDVAFNEGHRAFIHEILLDLDRIQNHKKTVVVEGGDGAESE